MPFSELPLSSAQGELQAFSFRVNWDHLLQVGNAALCGQSSDNICSLSCAF